MSAATGALPMTTGVVRVGPEHAEHLAAFYRAVWDQHATAERVRQSRSAQAATNPHGAGVEVPTFLFFDKGQAVGHVTTIPVKLWCHNRSIDAHWLKGLMVLPEYRNGPIGYLVLRHALAQLDVALAAVVAPDARRLFEALGFAEVGVLPNPVRILDATAVLRSISRSDLISSLHPALRLGVRMGGRPWVSRLTGSMANAALRVYGATVGAGAQRAELLREIPERSELDRLWRWVNPELKHAVQRDGAYLESQYPIADYGWIGVRNGNRLTGLAIVRAPRADGDVRLQGTRVATLADMLVRPSDQASMRALLHAAHKYARRVDADAVLCSASHPALLRSLYRTGYLPYAGNVRILSREGTTKNLAGSLADWWLTRGDSSADEVF